MFKLSVEDTPEGFAVEISEDGDIARTQLFISTSKTLANRFWMQTWLNINNKWDFKTHEFNVNENEVYVIYKPNREYFTV